MEVELERVVKELEITKKVAAAADVKAQVVAAKLDEGDDDRPESEQATSAARSVAVPSVTPTERQVLKAITESQFATRSITGVAKDTGLSRSVVQMTYGKLIEEGLLDQMNNDEGQLRWYPTALGRIVANDA